MTTRPRWLVPIRAQPPVGALEERLAVCLLTRNSRTGAPTDAGEKLFRNLSYHFEQIEAEVASLTQSARSPPGTSTHCDRQRRRTRSCCRSPASSCGVYAWDRKRRARIECRVERQ